jgi:hypothetical protein
LPVAHLQRDLYAAIKADPAPAGVPVRGLFLNLYLALVVWDERPAGGSDDVAVDLGAVRPTVTLYDPTTGTAPTQVLSGVGAVTVTVSDHPVVIEL